MSLEEKKTFWLTFLIDTIVKSLIIGVLLIFFQKYMDHQTNPLTAAETLKKENFLNAKRDVYFDAIQLVNRQYSFTDFTDENGIILIKKPRNRGATMPTEFEVNTCFSKLCIYSDNKEITRLFKVFFLPKANEKPIQTLQKFINLLRQDLGYENNIITSGTNDYEYISIGVDDTKKTKKTKKNYN